MTDLPASVYVVVGSLVVGNAMAIITFMTFIFKSGVFVAETKVGIKDAKDTAIRAHKRIDNIEKLTIQTEGDK